jgi:hypothetical protein
MKNKKENFAQIQKRKYNMMIITLIVLSVAIIASVWVIYKHKSEELDREMYLLKSGA